MLRLNRTGIGVSTESSMSNTKKGERPEAVASPHDRGVPHWVPEPVEKVLLTLSVQETEGDHTSRVQFDRLIVDPRLERVWKELLRRHRANHPRAGTFVYPARLPADLPEHGEARQSTAILLLLLNAVALSDFRQRVVTKREAEDIRRRRAELKAWRDERDTSHPTTEDASHLARKAKNFANSLKRMAASAARFAELMSHHPMSLADVLMEQSVLDGTALVVDRDTGDPEARFFAIKLSAEARRLFGKALHAPVARIATAVLERQITTAAVKEWCRRVVG
jgi:hypothetical protein